MEKIFQHTDEVAAVHHYDISKLLLDCNMEITHVKPVLAQLKEIKNVSPFKC